MRGSGKVRREAVGQRSTEESVCRKRQRGTFHTPNSYEVADTCYMHILLFSTVNRREPEGKGEHEKRASLVWAGKEDKGSMGESNQNPIRRRETKRRRGEVQRRLAEEQEKQSISPKTIAVSSSNLPFLDLIQQKISMCPISGIQRVFQLGFKVTKIPKSPPISYHYQQQLRLINTLIWFNLEPWKSFFFLQIHCRYQMSKL